MAWLVLRFKLGRAALAVTALVLAATAGMPSAANADVFSFSTGNPDGKMAMASRPDSAGKPEIEAADDFVLTAPTAITHVTFTGIMPASAGVQSVNLEIYRVFPLDSNTSRTPRVPTRVGSPSDVALQSRSSSSSTSELQSSMTVLANPFTAANSVLDGIHPAPGQTTSGEGPVTGQEVQFTVIVFSPFDLPPGHYFFVPQVQLFGPASPNFYWLSAPKPIVPPGTAFPAGSKDLQAWIRNSALQPDWLRVGTDIVGGSAAPTFNGAFSLDNSPLPFSSSSQQLVGSIGIRLAVRVPTAGSVRAFDPAHKHPWFTALTVRAKHAGVVHLKIVPNATGRAQIAKKRTIHLVAKVTFTPPGGRPAVRRVPITWRR